MKRSWEIKKLGEVCDIVNGSTPLRTNKDFWEGGDFPWFTIDDIRDQGRIISNTKQKVTQVALKKLKVLPIGTILLCCTASIGEYAITEIELTTNQQFNGLVIKNRREMYPMFLMYFSSTLKDTLSNLSGKTTIDFIPISRLKDIEIPLPPLPEQKRIVAILDEAFAAIAKAKANAEQNLKNAKKLFESYLQGVFENGGEGWEEKKLIEVTNKIGSGATPRGGNESYKTEGISLVRSMNVYDFEFRNKNLALIDDQQAKELNNVTLQENDVLLNITGASVARCCIVPKEYLPARVNQHVSIIRAKKEIIVPFFLNLLLTSKFYKDQLLFTGGQGATRQAITKAQLEVLEVSFPKSIKAQQVIVQKLNVLSTETKKLEAIYQQKINDLEELKKSILQKAFAGELHSPEGARYSNDWASPIVDGDTASPIAGYTNDCASPINNGDASSSIGNNNDVKSSTTKKKKSSITSPERAG